MKKVFFCLFFCLFFLMINNIVFSDDCLKIREYENKKNAFSLYDGIVKYELKYNHVVVEGNKKKEILEFCNKLTNAIIEGDRDSILNESKGADSIIRSNTYQEDGLVLDITTEFRKQLYSRNGPIYDFFFSTSNNQISLKRFLLCKKGEMEWVVLFDKKEKQYEVWFKMPDSIIYEFGFFHFIIKEKNGKYVFCGF